MPDRICNPPRSDWDGLVPQLTAGEREVADFFHNYLEPEWEIYLQPWLNGVHPDLVLLHPERGVAVFEIKDWDPASGRYFVDDTSGRRVLMAHFPGRARPVPLHGRDNPFNQVHDYKEFLNDICLSFAGKSGYGRIMAGVIFTVGDPAYWERLADAFRGKAAYPTKWPVIGRDALNPDRRGRVFLEAGLSRSGLMTPELTDILRSWLREPDFYRTQRLPLPTSPRVRRLIFDSPGKTRVRRFNGPAGSGKSYIIAGRAAALAARGINSLVLGFNITLSWFLRDMAYRHLRNMVPDPSAFRVASKKMIFIHADLAHRVKPPLNGFGAILIDEGTDLSADQIESLCVSRRDGKPWLAPNAEKMLAYDATQDLYNRGSHWAVRGGPIGPFNTNPTRLPDSYRLPESLLPILRDYAQNFLYHYPTDLPDPNATQGQLSGPIALRWIQVDADADSTSEISALLDEVKRMTERLPSDCSLSDIVVILPEHRQGFSFVTALRDRLGIYATHVFGEGKCVCNEGPESWKDCLRCAKSRVLKLAFRGGTGKLKASTYHSFKGWEARNLILFADSTATRSDCVGFYVGLSRFARGESGGMLTVVSSCKDLADFGRRHFDDYACVG